MSTQPRAGGVPQGLRVRRSDPFHDCCEGPAVRLKGNRGRVAHSYQFPDQGPLDHRDFSGGTPTVSELQSLGFQIVDITATITSSGRLFHEIPGYPPESLTLVIMSRSDVELTAGPDAPPRNALLYTVKCC